jgi:hypothetical protein
LAKAAEGEAMANEAKAMGDHHAEYALRQKALSWLEEAIELEAKQG